MTKPKHTEESIRKSIHDLYRRANNKDFLSYEALMGEHKPIIMVAKVRLKDNDKVQAELKEIKRQALIQSVRKLKRDEIRLEDVLKNHPGLERVARLLYSRTNEKSPWQLLIEDAGLRYPCRKQIRWNLKKLLEEVSSIGDNPEEFYCTAIYSKNSAIVGASVRQVGCFGKAVILTGVDYLQKERIPRRSYTFEKDELVRIVHDESLNYEGKTRCIFNALALQYYDWQEYESQVWRMLAEIDEEGFNLVRNNQYFRNNLGIFIQQNQENLVLLRVGISLRGSIENRIHDVIFYFSGQKSVSESLGFYENLDHTLRLANKEISN